MKLFKFFLPIVVVMIACLAWAQNKTSIVEFTEPIARFIPTFQEKGCGYSRPLRVAGMIGNPPFGWVERHDERSSKDLESYGLGRLVLDKLAEKLKISYVSTGFLSYNLHFLLF